MKEDSPTASGVRNTVTSRDIPVYQGWSWTARRNVVLARYELINGQLIVWGIGHRTAPAYREGRLCYQATFAVGVCSRDVYAILVGHWDVIVLWIYPIEGYIRFLQVRVRQFLNFG